LTAKSFQRFEVFVVAPSIDVCQLFALWTPMRAMLEEGAITCEGINFIAIAATKSE
jgi:hypothetical protein